MKRWTIGFWITATIMVSTSAWGQSRSGSSSPQPHQPQTEFHVFSSAHGKFITPQEYQHYHQQNQQASSSSPVQGSNTHTQQLHNLQLHNSQMAESSIARNVLYNQNQQTQPQQHNQAASSSPAVYNQNQQPQINQHVPLSTQSTIPPINLHATPAQIISSLVSTPAVQGGISYDQHIQNRVNSIIQAKQQHGHVTLLHPNNLTEAKEHIHIVAHFINKSNINNTTPLSKQDHINSAALSLSYHSGQTPNAFDSYQGRGSTFRSRRSLFRKHMDWINENLPIHIKFPQGAGLGKQIGDSKTESAIESRQHLIDAKKVINSSAVSIISFKPLSNTQTSSQTSNLTQVIPVTHTHIQNQNSTISNPTIYPITQPTLNTPNVVYPGNVGPNIPTHHVYGQMQSHPNQPIQPSPFVTSHSQLPTAPPMDFLTTLNSIQQTLNQLSNQQHQEHQQKLNTLHLEQQRLNHVQQQYQQQQHQNQGWNQGWNQHPNQGGHPPWNPNQGNRQH